jgi:outer membrane protein
MKNGLLIWNVVLTVVVGYLLFSQVNKKISKSVAARHDANDSSGRSSFRIAYFEMDSLESNFEMVKDVKAEINKEDEKYSTELSKLDQLYNKQYNEYAQSAKTQQDVENAQNNLRLLSDKLKEQKQDLDQKYQNFVMRQNLSVKKTIQDFLLDYNKEKNYSYIVSYEQGLFYYRDTAYDITADLIKGLNEDYKKVKGKKD